MRRTGFFAPLGPMLAAAALASTCMASPGMANAQPGPADVSVSIGGDLIAQVRTLGERDVRLQSDELADAVRTALDRSGAFRGAQVRLVLTDLKPNRPTFQQAIDKPGLSITDSISIGGATIEGEVVTADGQHLPIHYSRYSNSIVDVFGYNTWEDANRAFDRLADHLVAGRLVSR